MRLAYAPYILKFKRPAGTSRGILMEKPTFFIKVFDESDPSRFGIGECSVFPGLSPEADGNYGYKLIELLANIALGKDTDLSRYSSIQFGLEQALRDYAGGCRHIYFPSLFTQGEGSIEINGLVWMGDFEEMIARIDEKVKDGFHCLKLKIGAIDWTREVEMIEYVRKKYSESDLQIRVDANGGFSMDNALPRLKRLADLGVHSIEQPIPPGTPELMSFLCKVSPLPIALDESLIGIHGLDRKADLLDETNPAFIILKPSLCGGFSGAEEWIRLAVDRGIGWWVTSALESNVGLNALAQWTATLDTRIPQGLGTGALFTNNFESPLRLEADRLRYDSGFIISDDIDSNLDWRY
ncbi:MAG: o-succinylbenzoate synthase [Muribaculaceae bacterium]|nr:o-succinylbenzoate synthase [Muribaculaceae bacterium]